MWAIFDVLISPDFFFLLHIYVLFAPSSLLLLGESFHMISSYLPSSLMHHPPSLPSTIHIADYCSCQKRNPQQRRWRQLGGRLGCSWQVIQAKDFFWEEFCQDFLENPNRNISYKINGDLSKLLSPRSAATTLQSVSTFAMVSTFVFTTFVNLWF